MTACGLCDKQSVKDVKTILSPTLVKILIVRKPLVTRGKIHHGGNSLEEKSTTRIVQGVKCSGVTLWEGIAEIRNELFPINIVQPILSDLL